MTESTTQSRSESAQMERAPSGSEQIQTAVSYGIQHILVCIDGEAGSAVCVASALALADIFDARVTLMHVMQHHNDQLGPHTTNALGWEIARQEALARLEQLERDALQSSGRSVAVLLEQGKPADRIVALSCDLGVDLVVLGSHEAIDHPSYKLGATAQQVLEAARSSVLIARGRGAPPTFTPPKRILVPLDGSVRTESVLPSAESIARAYEAELVLVHVVAEPLQTGILADPEDLKLARELAERLKLQAGSYLEAIRHHGGYDEALIETLVECQTDKRQFLVELSTRLQIDLIVLSAHGSTCNPARPFGSVTAHLLAYSKVPLLVLQDLPRPARSAQGGLVAPSAPSLRGAHPQVFA